MPDEFGHAAGPARAAAVRYAAAFSVMAGAIGLRWLLSPWVGEATPFATVFPAVAAAVWLGGWKPAAVSAAAGYFAAAYLFVGTEHRLRPATPEDWLVAAMYGLSCGLIIGIGERMRFERRRAGNEARLRHAAEEETRRSEQRFRAAFNRQLQFMAILSPDGKVLEANDTCFRATGFRPGQVIGRPFWDAPWWERLPEERESWRRMAAEANRTGGSVSAEVGYHVADGACRRATVVVTALKGSAGDVESLIVEGQDVTERRRAEDALRESEARWRTMAEALPNLVWTDLPDGNCDWLSSQWGKYTGIPERELLGLEWVDRVLHPDDRERTLACWRAACEDKAPYDLEYRIRRHDGAYRWFKTRGVPVRDAQGRITYWFGTCTDIEDLRQAQEALARREREFKALVETNPDIIFRMDRQGRHLYVSPAVAAVTGLAPEHFLGKTNRDLGMPEDLCRVWEGDLARAFSGAPDVRSEFDFPSPRGVRSFQTLWVREAGADGQAASVLGIARDVTALKQAEEAARRNAERLRLLSEASRILAESLDYEKTLAAVARSAVPVIADWCAVDIREDDGEIRRLGVAHSDPAKIELARELWKRYPPRADDPTGLMNVLRTGEPELYPEIPDEMLVAGARDAEHLRIARELGLRSAMVVPLRAEGRVFGGLTLVTAESGRRYGPEDLALARELGDRAAAAVENARLHRRVREQADLLDAILAASVDNIYVFDRGGRYLRVSEGAARVLGRSPAEMTGRTWRDLELWPAIMEPVDAHRERVMATGRAETHEAAVEIGGGERHFEFTLAPIPGKGGVQGVVSVSRDITARKESERRLQDEIRVSETLNRIGGRLASELDQQKLVQTVTDEGTGLTGAQFGAFFYNVVAAGESYRLYSVSGVPPEAFAKFPMPRNTAVFEPTFRGTGVVRLDDVTQDPRYGRNAPRSGMPEGHLPVRSYLAVPVVSRSGEVLGGLFFGHPQTGVFTERHERLITGIAAQAAVAIDNARLYAAAKTAERRLQVTLNSIGDAVISTDERGRVSFLNPVAERMTGWSRDQAAGRPLAEVFVIVNERTGAPAEDPVAKVLRDGNVVGMANHTALVARDGTRTPIEDSAAPIRGEDGRITGVVLVFHDVTQRRRAEEELHRLAAVVETSTDLIGLAGMDGRILYFNPAGLAMLGLRDLEEARARSMRDFVMPEDLDFMTGRMIPALMADGHWQGRWRYRSHKTGAAIPISKKVTLIRSPDTGEPLAFATVSRDVSDLVAMEEERSRLLESERSARQQAERANRVKDEFLAVLSHELRTPLNAVLGWASMLRSGMLEPQETAQALEVIERNAKAQAQLVADLLDVSRIVTGKLLLDVHPMDLSAVVAEAVESLALTAAEKGVRLESVLPRPMPVTGDPDRLRQVAANLVSNAVKFTPKGGRVDVRLERAGTLARITVADTGKGIAPDLLPRLFERFRQGDDDSTRRTHGGLGLGLALVRHLVKMHRGEVRAESPGEGKGAVFTVELPLSPESPAAPGAPAAAAHGDRRLDGVRVLLVDDQFDGREMAAAALRNRGAEVRTVGSAAEALEALDRDVPDVLVSDIGMPERDGYDLIADVRRRPAAGGGTVPAVALTAFAGPEDRERAERAGFQAHVAKPLDPDLLSAAVAGVVFESITPNRL